MTNTTRAHWNDDMTVAVLELRQVYISTYNHLFLGSKSVQQLAVAWDKIQRDLHKHHDANFDNKQIKDSHSE
jgi:hypothetical protein